MRVKHSVEKQEEVCRILWEVARKAQVSIGKNKPKLRVYDMRTLFDGTTMPGYVMRAYLSEIMGLFGYDLVEIQ